MEEKIAITEYDPAHQSRIDRMMQEIQIEFSEIITTKHSTVIRDVYQLPSQKYWVAFAGSSVAGTIGVVLYGKSAVIKRMMVHPQYRGPLFKTAQLLFDTARDWAKAHQADTVYLGTMNQFKAAQRFYTKNGFIEIPKEQLPSDYNSNPMDTLFYKLDI